MTSVGHALYGKNVAVRALPSDDLERLEKTTDATIYSVRLEEGHLVMVPAKTVTLH